MKVTVTGKHMDVADALRQRVIVATAAIVERYFGKATEAHVVFGRERHHVTAEILVHARRGLSVLGGGTGDDAALAFDSAAERVDKRLRRHKRRLRNHHARAKDDAAAPVEEAATAYVLAADDDNADAGDGEPLVIAEMRTSIPELSVSEAVMRLDLGELPALLFRNRARGNLNVVYRRPDGNFGWIDPDLAAPQAGRDGAVP
ncbi:MAG TPA: ribosome-associated translation inhibitor RaiA [Stellaceae bacterium]|nr:ribosome-associated translation inhibitor RaiA [Stellaceae bacterium]